MVVMGIRRHSASWMTSTDERILETLNQIQSASPKEIADRTNIHRSRPTVNQRLLKLAGEGLTENSGSGEYQITTKGELFLIGKYDAQTDNLLVSEETASKFDGNEFLDKLKSARDRNL
jgi:predicted ArsR family transcriptional regulator